MLEKLILLLLFVANIILIHKLRPYSEIVAGGIELTPLMTFLAGYWLGPRAGVILGIVFIMSSYAASMEFSPTIIFSVPASALLGLFGALAANIGVSAGTIIGIIGYCAVVDLLTIKVFQDDEYLNMAVTDAGLFMTNVLIAKIFF